VCPIFAPFSQIGPKVWVRGGAGAAARESETHLDHDEGSSIFVEGERHDGLLVYPARNSLSRPLLLRLLSATPISVSLPLLLDFQTLRTALRRPAREKKKKKTPAQKTVIPKISAILLIVKLANELAVFFISIFMNQFYHFVSSNFCC